MVAKKRLLAGLASLTVMGIALAGCGSYTNNSSNTPKDEKVTITYMHRLPDKEGMTLVNDIVASGTRTTRTSRSRPPSSMVRLRT